MPAKQGLKSQWQVFCVWKNVSLFFSYFLFVCKIDKGNDHVQMSCPENADAKSFFRYVSVDTNATLWRCKWKYLSLMEMLFTKVQMQISISWCKCFLQMHIFVWWCKCSTKRCKCEFLFPDVNVPCKDANSNLYFLMQMLTTEMQVRMML